VAFLHEICFIGVLWLILLATELGQAAQEYFKIFKKNNKDGAKYYDQADHWNNTTD
jgi:hypothetical protein